ncbi:B-box zinc finger protein 20 [Phtheirospermum japonicum]|uniref:B-box zinc finger protein 20 n=1 Tax=Phtheirospermum japonicum TaxID=374723 RepID=A0A830B6I9_9LAMI|nr:B-box zinc finger protein 20 [Phtheirospermum japonicum]
MFVSKRQQLFSAPLTRLPFDTAVTIESTTPISSLTSILVFLSLILNSNNHRSATFARKGKYCCFVKKTELFYAESAMFQYIKPMNLPKSTTGFY